MSFEKKGTPSRIEKVASTDVQFEDLRKKIAEENNLVRCENCSKLLSKKGEDGSVDLQHKHLALVVKATEMKIKCPACDFVNKVI